MFVSQKAQEISYALVRIAPYMRRKELRARVERLAFELLEDVASKNFEKALGVVDGLIAIVNLGRAIYEIEPINAKVIIGELNMINSAMRQIIGLDDQDGELPNLESIFSKVPAVIENRNLETEEIEHANGNGSNGNGMAATIRQSAILDKIRQSDDKKVQLKDLISDFPEVSERTMRYDLQKLCSQGLLERIGNGGPGSYYSLK